MQRCGRVPKLDHPKRFESLLTRILVAPAFLYRLEQPAKVSGTQGRCPTGRWQAA